jgi:hypothetical protein
MTKVNVKITRNKKPRPRIEKLCFVLHGFQLPQHRDKFGNYQNDLEWFNIALQYFGIPATVRLKLFEWVELTKPIQEWYFKIFSEAAKGTMTITQLKKAWASFWLAGRAFNDHLSSADGYIDWINNPNGVVKGFIGLMAKAAFMVRSVIVRAQGIGLNAIVCSGAVLEILEWPRTFMVYGEPCWKISTFNSAHMDYTATPTNHGKYKFFIATNATRIDGIEDFPQLGGLPIPTPIIGKNRDYEYIPCDRVRVLSQTEMIPSPYWP